MKHFKNFLSLSNIENLVTDVKVANNDKTYIFDELLESNKMTVVRFFMDGEEQLLFFFAVVEGKSQPE